MTVAHFHVSMLLQCYNRSHTYLIERIIGYILDLADWW